MIVQVDLGAQNSDEFIYGKVITESGETYKGFMRWGKEELAWHDVFNSVKADNKYSTNTREDKSFWKDFSWNISSLWEDKYSQVAHTFACFFGDIHGIYPDSGDRLQLELKNGTLLKLDGGSNDVGTTIQMHDYELGLIKLDWNKIESIEFEQAPYFTKAPYGDLLYGVVNTYRKGQFEGYIKWDLDERVSTDVLDGYSDNGEQEIQFANIEAISKHKEGALVTLKSGREFFLRGTNDVNRGNRGIAIYSNGIGRIELGWEEFKDVQFKEAYQKGPSYRDFSEPVGIKARVSTYDDDKLDGLIVFDVDERWELEFMDGDDDKLKYQIPFRHIKTIHPKNKSYSLVELKNGDSLLLGEKQDVSYKNDGILLFKKSQKDPLHIPWSKIVEIRIE